jgi:hypothetical protein
LKGCTGIDKKSYGTVTLYGVPFKVTYSKISILTTNQYPTIRPLPKKKEIQDELVSVPSPVLRESQLLSFPSLINMLKFRE